MMEKYPELTVDEKWSIVYDPTRNSKPLYWKRYGELHSPWDENNPTTALFYSFMELKDAHP